MREIWLIVVDTARNSLRRQFVLFAVAAVILSLSTIVPRISELSFAERTGQRSQAALWRVQLVVEPVEILQVIAIGVGLVLGSTALPGALRSRRAQLVLARPISRSQFALGLAGGESLIVLTFALLTCLVGGVLAAYVGIQTTPLFWIGLAQTLPRAILIFGVSFGLSSMFRPLLAGAITFLLFALSSDSMELTRHGFWLIRWIATFFSIVGPARLPGYPLKEGLQLVPTEMSYAPYAGVVIANFLYATSFVLLALGWLERRKELISE